MNDLSKLSDFDLIRVKAQIENDIKYIKKVENDINYELRSRKLTPSQVSKLMKIIQNEHRNTITTNTQNNIITMNKEV